MAGVNWTEVNFSDSLINKYGLEILHGNSGLLRQPFKGNIQQLEVFPRQKAQPFRETQKDCSESVYLGAVHDCDEEGNGV